MPQALYRRYRPDTFADVIGQEHVTGPLQQALQRQRVSHAYLFSGPRGCGKTTSARILARCLNCAQGPTPTPCGECDSCRELARGGPGSVDVIEIDAASHGGVEDARELRDKAFFVPAAARFKIYIIDEAHMVTTAGFNALLKVVEEPPEHVKFVFATTEPDKVITTIRSRTHHYPFRLVPPGTLTSYLGDVCKHESVEVDAAALALVVRAGRGSVRDALSLLDQLISGAGEQGVSRAYASALLGYTDAALLDDTVAAFAARDGAAVFRLVDRVIEAGHDPRRFTEDLLERLRDLVVINALPDAAGSILADVPSDQLELMRRQAAGFGAAELSRAADLLNSGLTDMRGATSPRLQLELTCARILLPAAGGGESSLAARLDRLERRLALAGAPSPPPAAASPSTPPAAATPSTPPAAVTPPASEPVSTPAPAAAPEPALDVVAVRRSWPEVLDAVKGMRRHTWTLLSHNAQVASVQGGTLTLTLVNAGARDSLLASGGDEIVRQALIDVLAVDWRVEAVLDPTTIPPAPPDPRPRAAGSGRRPTGAPRPAATRSAAASHVPATVEPTPEDAGDADLSGADLLVREFGAELIKEFDSP